MTDLREEKTLRQHALELVASLEGDDERRQRLEKLRERAWLIGSGLTAMIERAYDEAAEEREPLCIETPTITVTATIYTGGPAGGIDFECDMGRYGLEYVSARAWHQDWFTAKEYVDLDDTLGERLFTAWGIEYAMGEPNH